ncbi:hypothetical protein [Nostoc sp. PA-18-2419]|uniref:hypothetical protein n=1 Tax=Nostoc sp. PA-18-2419 TaxID=2575443 RepID=UPI00110903B6|nr:hypothetical protein [Nostoc sp. PA-18-2419]
MLNRPIVKLTAEMIPGFEILQSPQTLKYHWQWDNLESSYVEHGEDGFKTAFLALVHFTNYLVNENRLWCSYANNCHQDSTECECKNYFIRIENNDIDDATEITKDIIAEFQ